MGAWGPGIFSNDTASDVRDSYFDLYDNGSDLVAIREQLERDFKEGDRLQDNTDLWLSLAACQWRIGHMDADVLEKVRTIVHRGIDIEVWHSLDATPATLRSREKALHGLLAQIQTRNSKPRPRRRKSIPSTIFKTGECYAVRLSNGNYTAIVVLADKKDEFTFNLIASTAIYQTTLPTISDVIESELLVIPVKNDPFERRHYRESIAVYMNVRFKKIIKDFIRIGVVNVAKTYDDDYLKQANYCGWGMIPLLANKFLVEGEPRSSVQIRMKDILG